MTDRDVVPLWEIKPRGLCGPVDVYHDRKKLVRIESDGTHPNGDITSGLAIGIGLALGVTVGPVTLEPWRSLPDGLKLYLKEKSNG